MELRQKIGKAKAAGIDVISLAIGDPVEPTPDEVIHELARAAHDPANHQYPTDEEKGMLGFREAVARWYAKRYGVDGRPAEGDPGADRLEGGLPPLRPGAGQPGRRRC